MKYQLYIFGFGYTDMYYKFWILKNGHKQNKFYIGSIRFSPNSGDIQASKTGIGL